MTVEEQRSLLAARIKARAYDEWQAILDARPRLPGRACPKCGAEIVGMMATMREPPFWRRCSRAECDWSEEIDG